MTLRVEDLKPGDVVRIDLVVTGKSSLATCFDCGDKGWFTNQLLAAGNAELVVRPRPVRKGDEVRVHEEPWTFVALTHNRDWAVCGNYAGRYEGWGLSKVTHADGSPIDWEASE